MLVDKEKHNNSCFKVVFESYADAQKVLSGMKNHGRSYGKSGRRRAFKKAQDIYKCPDCGKYHLTSKKNKG